MADYRNNVDLQNAKNFGWGNTLEQLQALSQRQQQQEQFAKEQQLKKDMPGIQSKANIATDQGKSDIEAEAGQKALQSLLSPSVQNQVPAGSGVSVGQGTASITKPTNMGVYDLKKQQQDTAQVNKYAQALKPTSDFLGAAQELETVTNRDGKGGVFTNPNAKLLSGGKLMSAVPDSAMGLASMIPGIGIDPSAAAERKAIRRYSQAIGVAMGGARGMSPGIQQGINSSLGQIGSNDPDLMAKGIRGAARMAGRVVQTAQSGFSPDIRDQAHANSGMSDPMEFFKGITPEAGAPVNQKLPPDPGNIKPLAQPGQPQSTPQPSAPKAQPSPAGGFDPDAYLKGTNKGQ